MINLNNNKFFYDPFPHAMFENAFDKNFYDNICKEFPIEQKFEKFDYDKQNQIKQNKFVFNDNHQSFKKMLKNKHNISDLYSYLTNQHFRKLILDFLEQNYISLSKYEFNQNILNRAYKKIKKAKKFLFEFSMIPTDGGYIKPHTDGADKLVIMVIPIVDNENLSKIVNAGTKILKPTDDKYKYNYLNSTVPFEATEVIREIPFKKNQFFLFVKTHNSLHSVGPMINPSASDKTLMRKTINFFIYK